MTDSNVYDNRELSWLKFNQRVLEEAQDVNVPLFERMRFISIFTSNLDEFFMVRVGSLYDQDLVDPQKCENKTGMTAARQLKEIARRVKDLLYIKDCAFSEVSAKLSEYAELKKPADLKGDDKLFLRLYFEREILPLLSPSIIDKNHPFPFLKNRAIYIGTLLKSKNEEKKKQLVGILSAECDRDFPRVIFLPGQNLRYVLAEDVILHYIDTLFPNFFVENRCIMRVTRNADIDVNEALYDHDMDFRNVMEELCRKRKKLMPVRAEFSYDASPELVKRMLDYLELSDSFSFMQSCPLDFGFMSALEDKLENRSELFYNQVSPQNSIMVNPYESMFSQLSQHDILLSYPYNKFKNFLRLLDEAADDPYVSSIKITLYRVARNSEIVSALIRAAENGKQVMALVELRARFDEENNIQWATKLEKAGCHVIYGLTGLKTHCKICLVVRKDKDGIRRYLHMGTGNYNDSTARFYTDIGMFTCREEYGVDASSLFNVLTGYSTPPEYNKFIVAPHGMRPFFEAMIIQETENAKLGLPAKITAKVNSLVDPEIISLLYDASNAGVKIDLIVRGICCLVPGVHGFSENIRVISIVGQLLEHSRIFIFENNSNPLYYMGSADWMPRNLDRRVELVFPVEDEDIKKRVQEVITVSFKDTVNARQQLSTGVYKSVDKRGKHKMNCQKFFSKLALKAQKQAMKKTYASTVGTPIVPVEVKKEDSEQ